MSDSEIFARFSDCLRKFRSAHFRTPIIRLILLILHAVRGGYMKAKLIFGIGTPDDTAGEFIEKWKNAESGDTMKTEYRLYFENLETLLKTLTPSRWELLKTLRINGPMTEDSLAARLGMNCTGIHKETKELETAGLISRRAEDLLEVSWDTIEAHLRLAA